jgi:hypothetical protein
MTFGSQFWKNTVEQEERLGTVNSRLEMPKNVSQPKSMRRDYGNVCVSARGYEGLWKGSWRNPGEESWEEKVILSGRGQNRFISQSFRNGLALLGHVSLHLTE